MANERLGTSFGSAEPREPYPLPCVNLITLITYQFSFLFFVCRACLGASPTYVPQPAPPYCTVFGLSTLRTLWYAKVQPLWSDYSAWVDTTEIPTQSSYALAVLRSESKSQRLPLYSTEVSLDASLYYICIAGDNASTGLCNAYMYLTLAIQGWKNN